MRIIRNKIIPFKGYGAINLFGTVFAKPWMEMNKKVINHESIHTAQMRELGYIPFYLIYLLECVYRLISCKGNEYRRLSFEREEYNHEHDLTYLKNRKPFAMWRKQI